MLILSRRVGANLIIRDHHSKKARLNNSLSARNQPYATFND